MKQTRKLLVAVCASLIAFSSYADCLGAKYVRGNDPCSENSTKRPNSFGDHNVSNSRMTREQEIAEDKRMAPIRARQEQEAVKMQEIKIAAEKERQRQQELSLRQEDINAKNRQAAATEAAAAASREAALAAARAAQSAENAAAIAAQRPAAPAPDNRPYYCRNGFCTH